MVPSKHRASQEEHDGGGNVDHFTQRNTGNTKFIVHNIINTQKYNRNRRQQEACSHPAHNPTPSPQRIPNNYPSKYAPEAGAHPSMPSWRLRLVQRVPVLCTVSLSSVCRECSAFASQGPESNILPQGVTFFVPPADRGSDLRLFVRVTLKCQILGDPCNIARKNLLDSGHARVREILACASYAVLVYVMCGVATPPNFQMPRLTDEDLQHTGTPLRERRGASHNTILIT